MPHHSSPWPAALAGATKNCKLIVACVQRPHDDMHTHHLHSHFSPMVIVGCSSGKSTLSLKPQSTWQGLQPFIPSAACPLLSFRNLSTKSKIQIQIQPLGRQQ